MNCKAEKRYGFQNCHKMGAQGKPTIFLSTTIDKSLYEWPICWIYPFFLTFWILIHTLLEAGHDERKQSLALKPAGADLPGTGQKGFWSDKRPDGAGAPESSNDLPDTGQEGFWSGKPPCASLGTQHSKQSDNGTAISSPLAGFLEPCIINA